MPHRASIALLAALALTLVALPASAQYGGGGVIIPNSGPLTGLFVPGLPIEPGSGRPYMDYVLTVSVPGSYTIDLVSASSSAYDPYLVLYQNGTELDRNDDGGGYPNSRITRFLTPGTYIVRVSSFRRGQLPAPASFSLTVTGGGGGYAPVGHSTGNGQMVAVGVPTTGLFLPSFPMDPSEGRPYIDYTFNVSYPGTYQIDLFSSSSTNYDPYLILFQYGSELERNDDGGGYPNSRITRFLSPGLYTIRVTSFRRGPVNVPTSYTLTVVQR